jgi:hypothetical protein
MVLNRLREGRGLLPSHDGDGTGRQPPYASVPSSLVNLESPRHYIVDDIIVSFTPAEAAHSSRAQIDIVGLELSVCGLVVSMLVAVAQRRQRVTSIYLAEEGGVSDCTACLMTLQSGTSKLNFNDNIMVPSWCHNVS